MNHPVTMIANAIEPGSPSYYAPNYPLSPPVGTGQDGLTQFAAYSTGVIIAAFLIAGAVQYQLGKAMAPSEAKESKWAWGNAIGGTLFPPITLGMAIYKNYFA
jgi:hypothetical protein